MLRRRRDLRASVYAKVQVSTKAAAKEVLAQGADALKCAC